MKAGYTQTAIANELGINPQTVSDVINGRTKSQRTQALIAQKLQKPVERIFKPKKHANKAIAASNANL